MSDYNSSLPVRTENNGDVVSKISDGTITTRLLAVNADGSINITDNGGIITVDGTVTANQGTAAAVAGAWPTRITDGVDTMLVNPDGSINVTLTSTPGGDEINNYKITVAVAGGASDNHDYTVTGGKTLILNQIETASSGKMKIEVQIETGVATNVFTTRFVQFNSTSTPNMSIHLQSPASIAAGVRVRVIRTNRDNQAQDVYSTISGQEV